MRLKQALRINSGEVPVWRRVEMLQKQTFRTNSDDVPVRVLVDADVSTVGSLLKLALCARHAWTLMKVERSKRDQNPRTGDHLPAHLQQHTRGWLCKSRESGRSFGP